MTDAGVPQFPESGPLRDPGVNAEFWRLGEVVRELYLVTEDLAARFKHVRLTPGDTEALRDLAAAAYRAHSLVDAAGGLLLAASMVLALQARTQEEADHA